MSGLTLSRTGAIKPSEKAADDPIDPPSPRCLDIVCIHCQEQVP